MSDQINPLIAQLLPSSGEIVPLASQFVVFPINMMDPETNKSTPIFGIGVTNITGLHFDWLELEQAKFMLTQLQLFIQRASAQQGIVVASPDEMNAALTTMKNSMKDISNGFH